MSSEASLRAIEDAAAKNTQFVYTGSGVKTSSRKNPKKGITTSIIVAILFGAGAFIYGASSALPSFINSIYNAVNLSYSANSSIYNTIIKSKLASGSSFSDSYTERLNKNGVEVSTNADGTTTLKYDGSDISASNYSTKISDDASFRDAMVDSNYGRASDYYDSSANDTFRTEFHSTRNVFNDYETTGDQKTDDATYHGVLNEKYSGDTDTNISSAHYEDEVVRNENGEIEYNSDGTPKTRQVLVSGESTNTGKISGETPEVKAQNLISASARAADASNTACTVSRVGQLISIAVTANTKYQSINFFLALMENISKMRAGYGSSSAINSVMNWFTTSTTNTYVNTATGLTESVTGSPIESSSLLAMINNSPVENTAVSESYSLDRITNAINTTQGTTTNCSQIKAGAAVISLASTAIPGGALVKVVAGFLVKTVIAVGVQVAISAALAFLIPTIAQALFTNVFEDADGVAGGELFSNGAAATNFELAKNASALVPSSSSAVSTYNQLNNQTILAEAEIDRMERSPFDITSSNTFLGSLVMKVATISASSSILSGVTKTMSVTSSSLLSLFPSTYAAGTEQTYITSNGLCTRLAEIGAVGDIHCNSIPTADTSILDMDPNDPTYLSVIAKNTYIDAEGNTRIIDNSDLADFILYYMERESPCGYIDANILNAKNSSLGIVGDNMPILNDIVDIVNAAEDVANLEIATCKRYVNSEDNTWWQTTGKYLQYFVLTTRIKDQIGDFEDSENPVLSFKEAYYTEHPLDNSNAGYLARITGMEKSDAQIVLDVVAYYQFLDEYDPETRYAFVQEKEPEDIYFDSEKIEYYILLNNIAYDKIKEKGYTA